MCWRRVRLTKVVGKIQIRQTLDIAAHCECYHHDCPRANPWLGLQLIITSLYDPKKQPAPIVYPGSIRIRQFAESSQNDQGQDTGCMGESYGVARLDRSKIRRGLLNIIDSCIRGLKVANSSAWVPESDL